MFINYPDYSSQFTSLLPLEVRVNGQRKGQLSPGQSLEIKYAAHNEVSIKLGLISKIKINGSQDITYTIANTWWLRNFNWVNIGFTIISILLVSIIDSTSPSFKFTIVGIILVYIIILLLVRKNALQLLEH